jgi:hypothetical protein
MTSAQILPQRSLAESEIEGDKFLPGRWCDYLISTCTFLHLKGQIAIESFVPSACNMVPKLADRVQSFRIGRWQWRQWSDRTDCFGIPSRYASDNRLSNYLATCTWFLTASDLA